MPTSRNYRRPPAPDNDDHSDSDLSLDELDPLPADDDEHSAHGSNGFSSNGFGAPGGLGARIQVGPLGSQLGRGLRSKAGDGHRKESERERDQESGSMNTASTFEDDAPLLANSEVTRPTRPRHHRAGSLSHYIAKFRSTPQSEVADDYDPSSSRSITVGQTRQASKFPPNSISNAKYTPWSFLPRTLYHEFSFFLNLYFLLVALSQIIPALRIGYLSTYVAPLAFVLVITLSKEAVDDITRRRRDAEANSERYISLVFEEALKSSSSRQGALGKRGRGRPGSNRIPRSRLAAIEEEEQAIDSTGAPIDAITVRETLKMSRDLKVGDVLKLAKDQRVPADLVILKVTTSDGSGSQFSGNGEAFIRTDQLDGETDWKLRLASPLSQTLGLADLSTLTVNAAKPERKVNDFVGILSFSVDTANGHSSAAAADDSDINSKSMPLTIDNTAWANTVIASSGAVYAVVVYTGLQTRQAMSTSSSRSKAGLLEYEINDLTKILCALTLLLSVLLVVLERIEYAQAPSWYIAILRFLILFSTIVPISLRVNLDLGKSVYAWFIQHDEDIPETIVRTSTIPEDLGRIEYLLSDKTGTLTQNDMQLRKIHVGTVSYANEAMSEVDSYIRQGFSGLVSSEGEGSGKVSAFAGSSGGTTRSRREIGSRVRDLVLALALCHNVTPTTSTDDHGKTETTYQASSPDEIAIIRWTEAVGLRLAHRDRQRMVLESVHTGEVVARAEVLNIFPFTSEGKRMGIILRYARPGEKSDNDESSDPVWFFQKGADTVMSTIVAANDWLEEETSNMAREGLRTLVVGRKRLSQAQYRSFSTAYKEASMSLQDRDDLMASIVKECLEHDLELLGVTGVEDKLQRDVKPSLELLRNAGVKIWMLTGDKVETARCVAVSSKLVARGQYVHTIAKSRSPTKPFFISAR